MLSQSDQLGNYVSVIKQLLNKAIRDILFGMLRTQELPFGMGGLEWVTKLLMFAFFVKEK